MNSVVHVCPSRYTRNLGRLRSLLPPGWGLCPVIKADAYGHGIRRLLPYLTTELAVGVVDNWEVIECRNSLAPARPSSFSPRVLRLRPVLAQEVAALSALPSYPCEESIGDRTSAGLVASNANGKQVTVQVYIDSGMGRAGGYFAGAGDLVAFVRSLPENLVVGGYMTHLPRADEVGGGGASEAITRFLETVGGCLARVGTDKRLGGRPLLVHYANSPTLVRYGPSLPALAGELSSKFGVTHMARPGISSYGPVTLEDPDRDTATAARLLASDSLEGVMHWHTKVSALRTVPAGQNIGYGTFSLERESLIATLPIGYADGLLRSMTGKGAHVLIAGQRCPIVGKVMMDITCVDVTDHPNRSRLAVGEPVEILGPSISGSEQAHKAGTIPYELFITVGTNNKRHGND